MAWIQNVKRSRSKRAGEGGDAKQGVGKKGWSASSRDRVRTALHKNVLINVVHVTVGMGKNARLSLESSVLKCTPRYPVFHAL